MIVRALALIALLLAPDLALAAPATPAARVPTGQTTTGFRARWVLVPGATTYRLDVSTSPTFASFVGTYNNYSTGVRDSLALTGLTQLTRYYYRVRSEDGTGASGNSNVRSAFTRPYTTWNGTSWSNSTPTAARPAVIDSFFTLSTTSYVTGRLYVNPGAVLTIDTSRSFRVDTTLVVEGSIVVASRGTKSGVLAGHPTVSGMPSVSIAGGSIQVRRLVSANRWHLLAAPLPGATAALFTGDFLRQYSEPTNAFGTYIANAATPLAIGAGFGVWTTTDRLVTFTGTPNFANVSPTVTRAGATQGYNLVGNPFTAPLDWRSANWTRTSLSTTMWQWVHSAGNYGTMTTGGTATNGVTRYIAPCQAFFVRATAANPVLQMRVNAIVLNNTSRAQGFYKALEDSSDTLMPPEPPVQSVLALTVTGDSSYQDEMLVHFDPTASESYNPEWDAQKLMGEIAAPQLYARLGNDIYTTKALPWPTGELRVPVSFKAGTASRNYTIHGLGDLSARLLDRTLGTSVDISNGLTYSFTADTADAADRFELVFDGASMVRSRLAGAAVARVSVRGSSMVFGDGSRVASVELFNASGRSVMNLKGPFDESLRLTVSRGNYIARVRVNGTPVLLPVAVR